MQALARVPSPQYPRRGESHACLIGARWREVDECDRACPSDGCVDSDSARANVSAPSDIASAETGAPAAPCPAGWRRAWSEAGRLRGARGSAPVPTHRRLLPWRVRHVARGSAAAPRDTPIAAAGQLRRTSPLRATRQPYARRDQTANPRPDRAPIAMRLKERNLRNLHPLRGGRRESRLRGAPGVLIGSVATLGRSSIARCGPDATRPTRRGARSPRTAPAHPGRRPAGQPPALDAVRAHDPP
jgi:hypothetical protein